MTILDQIIKVIRKEVGKLPDKRGEKNQTYEIEDIFMSAYSIFYFQNPSWLDYQRNMKGKSGKSNALSLFGI